MDDRDTDPPAPLPPLAQAMGLRPHAEDCPVCGALDYWHCDHRPPAAHDPDDPDEDDGEWFEECPF